MASSSIRRVITESDVGVILSRVKNLASAGQILRSAQNDTSVMLMHGHQEKYLSSWETGT